MLRFGGYLLRFPLASDWSRNNKHSRNFLWCSRFYGKDGKTRVLSSRANGTVLAYSPAFCKWKQFALDKLDGNAFPASPFYKAWYLQHLIEETHSPSAVDSAFYGLSGPMTWREFPTQLMIQLLRP